LRTEGHGVLVLKGKRNKEINILILKGRRKEVAICKVIIFTVVAILV
jgi:hypothetical protein